MYGIIYLITNQKNNKKYVGQTVQTLEQRWNRHVKDSYDRAKKLKMPILFAIKKYGKENFTIKKLCDCNSLEELNEMEKYYAHKYKTFSPIGYNLKAGNGIGSLSETVKRKIGDTHRGRKLSKKHREKLSKAHMGHVVSEETKEKLRKINKGKRPCKLAQENAIKSNAKTYTFKNPKGDIITFTNLKQFCLKNNLSDSKMVLVNQGRRNHHKGWTRVNNNEKKSAIKRCRKKKMN